MSITDVKGKPNSSSLAEFWEYIDEIAQADDEEDAIDYDTLEKAHAEIRHLRRQIIAFSIFSDVLFNKRPRGRPKKLREEEKIVMPGGRPVEVTLEEMKEYINQIDKIKSETGNMNRITDKLFFSKLVDVLADTKNLRSDKKKDFINSQLKKTKYYRDKTGIRQKRKTPSENH